MQCLPCLPSARASKKAKTSEPDKSIVILGGTGALGWALAMKYLEEGWVVYVYSRSVTEQMKDPNNVMVKELQSAQKKGVMGQLYVGNWNALNKGTGTLTEALKGAFDSKAGKTQCHAEAPVDSNGGGVSADHVAEILLRALNGESIAEFEHLFEEEDYNLKDASVEEKKIVFESSSSSDMMGQAVPVPQPTTLGTTSLLERLATSDLVMNAQGVPGPSDCIKSPEAMVDAWKLNAGMQYALGKLFAKDAALQQKNESTKLGTCSTNYVFELGGFEGQNTQRGYESQLQFPVAPHPVGAFQHEGEALANTLGFFKIDDETRDVHEAAVKHSYAVRHSHDIVQYIMNGSTMKSQMQEAKELSGVYRFLCAKVYAATRFLGEHVLAAALRGTWTHLAESKYPELVLYRFPGFYGSGTGSTNIVKSQLADKASYEDTAHRLRPDNIGNILKELSTVNSVTPLESVFKSLLPDDSMLEDKTKNRWPVTSRFLADGIFKTFEKGSRTVHHLNGAYVTGKPDWNVAGFLAFLYNVADEPEIVNDLPREKKQLLLQAAAVVKQLLEADAAAVTKRAYMAGPGACPQHLHDTLAFASWREAEAFFNGETFAVNDARCHGVMEMAQNLVGLQRRDQVDYEGNQRESAFPREVYREFLNTQMVKHLFQSQRDMES